MFIYLQFHRSMVNANALSPPIMRENMAKNQKKDKNASLREENIEKTLNISNLSSKQASTEEVSIFAEQLDKPVTQENEFYKQQNDTNERRNDKSRKKEKKQKQKQKTTLAHKVKLLSILLVLGIFTGSGLGVWYFNTNLKSPDYGALSADAYIKPISKVMSENFGLTSQKEIENWIDYVGDKTPDNLSNVDNVLLAIHNATLAKSFVFTGNGLVNAAGIEQTVYSQRRHINDIYTFESISKSKKAGAIKVEVANLDIYKKDKNNQIKLYTGKNISQKNADWYYKNTITVDEYQNMTGGLPSNITPYIISEKTVTSSTLIKDDNGNYVITFNLNPMTSVLNYYKEVRRTGGLDTDPEFNSIKFIATIDSKWKLISTEVFESYSAVKIIRVNCKGTIKIDYEFDLPEVLLPEIKG